MITAYVGVPGSGKSYESVKKILENIQLGRKIYTNIEGLDKDSCKVAIQAYCNITDFQLETCLNHLDEKQAQEFWLHCERGSLILIDEVHKLFSNRNWASDENKAFTEWASTHRHEGFDVVLITQDIEKVDKHARSLIEYTYLFDKVNYLGKAINKKYICYTYRGDDHKGRPMGTGVRTYDVKVFPCYQSYVADSVEEKTFQKLPNFLNHPVFYAIPCAFGIALYFAFNGSFFDGGIMGIGAKKAEASITQTQQKEDKENVGKTVASSFVGKTEIQSTKRMDSHEALALETPKQDNSIKGYRLQDGTMFWTNTLNIPEKATLMKVL